MALKDWKKVSDNIYKHKTMGFLIHVQRHTGSGGYYEIVAEKPFGIYRNIQQSKSLALKFAKQYMRTH